MPTLGQPVLDPAIGLDGLLLRGFPTRQGNGPCQNAKKWKGLPRSGSTMKTECVALGLPAGPDARRFADRFERATLRPGADLAPGWAAPAVLTDPLAGRGQVGAPSVRRGSQRRRPRRRSVGAAARRHTRWPTSAGRGSKWRGMRWGFGAAPGQSRCTGQFAAVPGYGRSSRVDRLAATFPPGWPSDLIRTNGQGSIKVQTATLYSVFSTIA